MTLTGQQNNFTCGEIGEEAWDRTDIQQVQKGCQLAQNYVARVQGPLGKRRGFWSNGPVKDQGVKGRIIPWRRSINDALVLELGDHAMRFWLADGSPVMDGDARYELATPWSAADAQTLRYKQVGDVVYFVGSAGLRPMSLIRNASNTDWTLTTTDFSLGPWRPENPAGGPTFTFTAGAGSHADANSASGAAYIASGTTNITIVASAAVFDPAHVDSFWRIRAGDGSPGVASWSPSTPSAGISFAAGELCVSNNRVYINTSSTGNSGSTPPVHYSGVVSDGALNWQYLHDGAGVVQVTEVVSATQVVCTAITTLPVGTTQVTRYWSEGAYSDYRGWPTAWPAMREERMVLGSTHTDPDFVDLTQTAGFSPLAMDFTPGTGTGEVTDIDAVRRRVGDDGSAIVWFATAAYLACGTETGEFMIAGSVLDEPITPSSALDKQQFNFGAADAGPVRVWDALCYIVQGGTGVRELFLDASQGKASKDLSVLATHLSDLGFAELAWARQDHALWAKLADGSLATFVYHKEQGVEGWCSVALGGGFTAEWMAVIPGENKLDTVWIQATRIHNGGRQRLLLMQSQPADLMFYDAADFYEGDAIEAVTPATALVADTVSVMADGAELSRVVANQSIPLPRPAAKVVVGLPYQCRFVSLKLDLLQAGPAGTLLERERITGATVSLKTVKASVGGLGSPSPPETCKPAQAANVPPVPKRIIQACTFAADTSRDPRVEVIDETGYDGWIMAIRPKVAR